LEANHRAESHRNDERTLYRNELRLMLNYFQPSVKPIERRRVGSRVRRVFDKPKTPFERLIELRVLSAKQAAAMSAERDAIDPIALAASIEHKVAAVLRFPCAGPSKRGPTQGYRNTFARAPRRSCAACSAGGDPGKI
jgi:hypothetical protein